MSRVLALCLAVALVGGSAAWRFAEPEDGEPFTPPEAEQDVSPADDDPPAEETGEPAAVEGDDTPAQPDETPAEPAEPNPPVPSAEDESNPTPSEPPAPGEGETPGSEPEPATPDDAAPFPVMPEESAPGDDEDEIRDDLVPPSAASGRGAIEFLPPIAIANPSDHADDWFGRSVATVGDRILVGGPSYRVANKGNAGAVFVFDREGTLLHTIANPSPGDEDRFGRSLAGLGSNFLVGAYKDDDDSGALNGGAAYLFSGRTARLVRSFTVPLAARYDYLGYSLAGVGGDAAVVGAAGRRVQDSSGAAIEGAGAAFLFDAASGELLRTFDNPQPRAGDWFGRHVDDAGGRQVLVAAPYADREFTDADGAAQLLADVGEVYLFDAATGELLVTFGHPMPAAKDLFGEATAVCGEHVLIGAPYADAEGRSNVGAVYVFSRDGEFRGALGTTGGAATDDARFGYALAALGDLAVVGTGQEYDAAAFLFDPARPQRPVVEFHADGGDADSSFGSAVATTGSSVVIGAPRADVVDALGNTIADSGRVYLFHPQPSAAARLRPKADRSPLDR